MQNQTRSHQGWHKFRKRISFVPGIVPRLRLVYILVSIVLLEAMLIGFLQMRYLSNSTDDLTASSVPVFAQTQEIERNLKSFLLLLTSITSVDKFNDLNPLASSLNEQISTLRAEITKLPADVAFTSPVKQMIRALEVIESKVDGLTDAKRDVLLYLISLQQIRVHLEESREAMRNALEQLAFEVSIEIGQRLLDDDSLLGITSHDAILLLTRLEGQAIAITELTLKIDAIVESAMRLQNVANLNELDQLAKKIRFGFRGISVLAGRLPNTVSRVHLAQEVTATRDFVLGKMGIVEQIALLNEQDSRVKQLEDELLAPLLQISTLSNLLAEAARHKVVEAGQNLISTAQHMTLVLILSGIFSILVFGVATLLIVERQINQRMIKLINAVRAIASGDTSYQVDVEGKDELGEMAKALETFKFNAEELRRSNTELEKFAYVAAHDLRSPLRAIQDLAEWTVEDEENTFSEDGERNMQLLQSRVNRLNLLLTDLLAYSRVGKEKDDIVEVSLAEAVDATSELLDPNNDFNITYTGFAHGIVTYATPLRQILLNLVNNSIKHHDRKEGHIQVFASLENGRVVLRVEDDGPGIEPQYHDRIFGLFQTLRPRDEVEGSGLGLAIIRKLVEHYGGTVHVLSDPAAKRGTTFKFDMPDNTETMPEQNEAA